MRQRRVVTHTPVDQQPPVKRHRREHARDRGGRHHGIDDRAGRDAQLASADEVGDDHVQGHAGVLEPVKARVTGDQPAQVAIRHDVTPASSEAKQSGQWAEREDRAAVKPAPNVPELAGSLHRRLARGDERSVDRAGGGPDDHVGSDPTLEQGLQHPDLDCAEARAA